MSEAEEEEDVLCLAGLGNGRAVEVVKPRGQRRTGAVVGTDGGGKV